VRDWVSWLGVHIEDPEVAVALGKWARWVGRRIASGQQYGIRQPEETLTNSLLLDLRRALPDLNVQMTSRAAESVEGADWEWWIEGESKWFGALIQAKRTTRRGLIDFGYAPSKSVRNPNPAKQIDSLIKTARARGIPPLYVLYNDANDDAVLSSRECVQRSLLPKGSAGVTVLSAYTAQWLLKAGGDKPVPLKEVAKHAVPWSCLVSCPQSCRVGLLPSGGAETLRERLGLDPSIPSGVDRAIDAAMSVGRLASSPLQQQLSAVTATEITSTGIRDRPPEYIPARRDHDKSPGLRLSDRDDVAARYVVSLYRRPR